MIEHVDELLQLMELTSGDVSLEGVEGEEEG